MEANKEEFRKKFVKNVFLCRKDLKKMESGGLTSDQANQLLMDFQNWIFEDIGSHLEILRGTGKAAYIFGITSFIEKIPLLLSRQIIEKNQKRLLKEINRMVGNNLS